MAKNPYYNPDPNQWWHGDEMFQGRSATVDDVWVTWENGTVDEDGWGRDAWIEDIRRSDYFGDMDEDVLKELMKLIASNRGSSEIQKLVKYTTYYFEGTLEI